MSFTLGSRSRSNLIGVHPKLIAVVERAIVITSQDFTVHDGLRTLEKQRAHVASGTSWTLASKHLRQLDGFGHAVDLVPFVAGELSWDWSACYEVAAAIASAANERTLDLRWGGVWDRPLRAYGISAAAAREACENYVHRRRVARKRAAIDGPHFELLANPIRKDQ